jgi:ABC-type nitrate/sulfonate/bicarbonate transport system permease component
MSRIAGLRRSLHIHTPSKVSDGLGSEKGLFLVPLTLIFGLWELVVRLSFVSATSLPPPSTILMALAVNALDVNFLLRALYSLTNLMAGIALGFLIAMPVAIATGLKSKVDSSFTPLIMLVGALPDLALLPIFVYWLGPGATAAILMGTVVAFFPIFFCVRGAVKAIPQDYFHVAAVFKARKLATYTKMVLPAIFPQTVTGVRLAYEFLWEIVLAVEIMAVVSGIGSFINSAVEGGSMVDAFAGIFLIGIIAIIIDRLVFVNLEGRIRRWQE